MHGRDRILATFWPHGGAVVSDRKKPRVWSDGPDDDEQPGDFCLSPNGTWRIDPDGTWRDFYHLTEAELLLLDALIREEKAERLGWNEALEAAAKLFELHNSFAWLCMDHGGEEAKKICKMIRELKK
jgi:hypothetical protein